MAKRERHEEKGVTVPSREFRKPSEQLQFYNPKLSNLREIVLATLSVEAADRIKPLICLDAIARSGIAGLQWKKHLGSSCHVVLAENDVDSIQESCNLNGFEATDWTLDPNHVIGQWPISEQGEKQVHVCPFSGQTALYQEAFNFVYVHTHQSTTHYTDSVFSNIRHNGVACFLCVNITSQCFRSPQLIQRLYQAYVQKTEYVKELALRVMISDLARAASRNQRGINVLYSLYIDDHFLVAVRVTKNPQAALNTSEKCGCVLHCLMCEERRPWPNQHTPIEQPYSLLPCDCKAKTPGKTAVILGPMWLGDICNVIYLDNLIRKCKEEGVNQKVLTLLSSVREEAACSDSVSTDDVVKGGGTGQVTDSRNSEPPVKRAKLETADQSDESKVADGTCGDNVTEKSPVNKNTTCSERLKDTKMSSEVVESVGPEQTYATMPLFYYDIQKKSYSGYPKLPKLVNLMRKAGYRTSRTHFEGYGIRTSASLKQMDEVIKKYKQTQKT